MRLLNGVLQPTLHQFSGAPVQLIGPPLDVGEHIDDPAQVLQIPAAPLPRGGRVRRVVGGAGHRLGV
jgi:hypothetical protein